VQVAADEDVFQHSHVGEQPNVLKRPCDAALGHLVWLEKRQVVSGKPDGTALRFVETADTVKNGGFASAIRTD
jgi:hypothetical protein